MKKVLSVALVLTMLLSLCACGGNDAQSDDTGSTETTGSVESTGTTESTGAAESTGATETTGAAESTGATETTGATEATQAPTQAPTQAATQPATQPAPTACSHNWAAATCNAPKTCTKCGATDGTAAGHNWAAATCSAPKTCTKCGTKEGVAAGHNWKDATCTAPKTCAACGATEGAVAAHTYANGVCSVCGAAQPKPAIDVFTAGWWKAYLVIPATAEDGEMLLQIILDGEDGSYSYKTYYSEIEPDEMTFGEKVYNGKTYYDLTFSGSMGGHTDTALPNGNVKVEMMNDVTMELKMESETKFVVVATNRESFAPVGMVFEED